MNKKLVIVIVSVLVVIVGAFAYILLMPKESTTTSTTATEPTSNTTTTDSPTPAATPSTGVYTTYSSDAFSKATGKRVLFFHAPWCPQCQALDKSITSSSVPSGVTIFKTDYDSNQALRKQYGVTLQTTVVFVDDQGKLVKKYTAYDSPTFEAVKQNLGL